MCTPRSEHDNKLSAARRRDARCQWQHRCYCCCNGVSREITHIVVNRRKREAPLQQERCWQIRNYHIEWFTIQCSGTPRLDVGLEVLHCDWSNVTSCIPNLYGNKLLKIHKRLVVFLVVVDYGVTVIDVVCDFSRIKWPGICSATERFSKHVSSGCQHGNKITILQNKNNYKEPCCRSVVGVTHLGQSLMFLPGSIF